MSFTTHFDWPLIEDYDAGRDLAHRLTFRRYDDSPSSFSELLGSVAFLALLAVLILLVLAM